jgi:hypothetical protein
LCGTNSIELSRNNIDRHRHYLRMLNLTNHHIINNVSYLHLCNNNSDD